MYDALLDDATNSQTLQMQMDSMGTQQETQDIQDAWVRVDTAMVRNIPLFLSAYLHITAGSRASAG